VDELTEICVVGTAINPVSTEAAWSRCPKKPRKCLICGEIYIPQGSRQKVCLGSKCEEILRRLYWEEGLSQREIASYLGFLTLSIYEWFKKLKIPTRSTSLGNAVKHIDKTKWLKKSGVWRPISSSDLSYILGVMKGDGNIYKNKIQFRTIDKPFAEKFVYHFKRIGINTWPMLIEKRSLKNINRKDVYCIFASSLLFSKWYRSLTLEELKKEVDLYPIPFICGFYESEGTIYDNQGHLRIGIFNIDKELLNMVYDFICELDFTPTFGLNRRKLRVWKNEKICYQITLCKKQEVPKFINLINPCIKQVPRGR